LTLVFMFAIIVAWILNAQLVTKHIHHSVITDRAVAHTTLA